MHQRDAVIPGERGIGDKRGKHAEQEGELAALGDGGPDIDDMDAPQLLGQEIDAKRPPPAGR